MNIKPNLEHLGESDIEIDGLRIWIHGRQFPNARNHQDGNWLNITAVFRCDNAEVWTAGNIIELLDLESWLKDAEIMNKELFGEANLECTEPELNVKLSINKLGQLKMIVNITPDVVNQKHYFQVVLDQTYLSPLITSIRTVLNKYPIFSP